MSADIIRGNNSAIGLQIAFPLLVPNTNGLANPIIASTADNPAKFTTKYPHGLSTGNKILITGENTNITILGNHTVTITDTTNGTLNGVTGWKASVENPTLYTTTDMSAITPVLKLKQYAGGPELKDGDDAIEAAITWVDRSIFQLIWTLAEADTAALPKGVIILSVSWTDAQGQDWSIDITYSVGDA